MNNESPGMVVALLSLIFSKYQSSAWFEMSVVVPGRRVAAPTIDRQIEFICEHRVGKVHAVDVRADRLVIGGDVDSDGHRRRYGHRRCDSCH
jgi:hypothetical protein